MLCPDPERARFSSIRSETHAGVESISGLIVGYDGQHDRFDLVLGVPKHTFDQRSADPAATDAFLHVQTPQDPLVPQFAPLRHVKASDAHEVRPCEAAEDRARLDPLDDSAQRFGRFFFVRGGECLRMPLQSLQPDRPKALGVGRAQAAYAEGRIVHRSDLAFHMDAQRGRCAGCRRSIAAVGGKSIAGDYSTPELWEAREGLMNDADPIISRSLIERLVGFDTTSRDSNLALIDFVESYLAEHGVESRRVYDKDKRKANLYATVGPHDRSGVMLSGHVDVVPVDGQEWSSDPFTLVERDGRLYGRGTADMKSFCAIALAYVPVALKRGLHTPIHLAFSYDEEVGCIGVRGLIDVLNGMPVKPAMCVVGEPTEMLPVVAHKGKRSFRVHVRGLECHSSLAPTGVNAVEFAAEAIAFLRGMARKIRAGGPFDPDFDIAHTTVHTGVVHGGTALNIVPKDCWFDFEFRHLPQQDADMLFAEFTRFVRETLEPEMQAVDPSTGFSWTELSTIPSLDTRPEDDVVAFVKALAGRNDHGKVAFGTEAGLFQKRGGIPTVVCGPGSIAQAHKPDEYITTEQVAKGEAFMRRLLDRVCEAPSA